MFINIHIKNKQMNDYIDFMCEPVLTNTTDFLRVLQSVSPSIIGRCRQYASTANCYLLLKYNEKVYISINLFIFISFE